VRGSCSIDLGIARIAHACSDYRRCRGRESCDGRTTGRVDKRKVRRVQERCRLRGASPTKDTTALSAMLVRKSRLAHDDRGKMKGYGVHIHDVSP
jgi:hypothetical protein